MSQWDSRTTMAAGLREAMGSGSRTISEGALIWMGTKGGTSGKGWQGHWLTSRENQSHH